MFSGHKNSDQIHWGAIHGSLVMLQITCYPDGEILEGNQVFLKPLSAYITVSAAEKVHQPQVSLREHFTHMGWNEKSWDQAGLKIERSQSSQGHCA